ncbi:reverse transcriptase/maturase family protein [Legionella lytica]|nr:reverse transcriptase/maturase family protein [Legionella lytica]
MKYGASLESLFQAYFDCRKNKRNTMNALRFETDYESNLIALYDELNSNTWHPGRSIAFVIDKPVKREIFAADFRDRVVHHWLINQLNPLFEKAFIYDSYASRKGRGAHMGIARAAQFIRKCSLNYQRDCYVLKLDIMSFFIRINRRILWEKLRLLLEKHYNQSDEKLILEVARKIVENEPTSNCFIKGKRRDWQDFPKDKSLFYARPHCGLPIGNLTSQVFANFYLNPFDHYIKHDLGVRFYGRYVDDFILVHEDKAFLKSLIPQMEQFLQEELQLELHPRKQYLQHYRKGIPFLGVMLKPHCIYAGRRIKGTFYEAITKHNAVAKDHKPTKEEQMAFLCSINSYLGILSHYQTYRLRKGMLKKHLSIWWWNLMFFSGGCAKLVAKQRAVR